MPNKTATLPLVLSILSLCCSIVCAALLLRGGTGSPAPEPAGTSTQYVMYVGTNDKDTCQPEHSSEEAMDIVDRVCLKYFEGYTLQEATGA